MTYQDKGDVSSRFLMFTTVWYPDTIPQHTTAHHITAQHSTAQHSTAHHITAHHSTAQHSTTQHTTPHHTIPYHTIPYHLMSSRWHSWGWYFIRMSYDKFIMSSGWHSPHSYVNWKIWRLFQILVTRGSPSTLPSQWLNQSSLLFSIVVTVFN